MRILGIGSDLVSIARVEQLLARHGGRFAERILHPVEWPGYHRSAAPAAYLARRFAAKEAVSKALGVGVGAHMRFTDAGVDHDDSGRPVLVLTGRAETTAARLGVKDSHISLSDEREYALAFVVLVGD
ncbi:holo-ACP synthase [Thioalkalivibrio denitrificans]|uniref:Holo-[acyl-carrier-protein] synthase n=1 Tax=Thioalkalivibrio denitrificans TaxID=108003 RepID=A0A1V3NQ35_9GAMM|nr:holo-ACP synthase [Thioalkalivibrio denitrificans]OOG27207.1 holo-ACP synthase [Thioalkalivibrio denitrificans]